MDWRNLRAVKILRRILGVILLPFLYLRFTFLLFIPLLFVEGFTGEHVFMMWFFYGVFIMALGMFGVLTLWTKLWVKILGIEYKRTRDWMASTMHSHSIWEHPTISMQGKDYQLMFASAGGNLYSVDTNIRRSMIKTYLFKH